MHIGVTLRNMGPESSRAMMANCAQAAERAGMESLWITDHIAIPPDDAQGSGGRYLDTLTTLAWLAGITSEIKLGSGVLIVPYRAKLPTAKQVATVQELSAGRLLLGMGIGWMDAEFRALGVDRHQRGAITDDTLGFLQQAFSQDEVSLNGQAFLANPRPLKPPFLIGGAAPHALHRAVKYGDGWLPMAREPGQIAAAVAEYQTLCKAAAKPPGSVSVMTRLPIEDTQACAAVIAEYDELGVERLICAMRYTTEAAYLAQLEALQPHI